MFSRTGTQKTISEIIPKYLSVLPVESNRYSVGVDETQTRRTTMLWNILANVATVAMVVSFLFVGVVVSTWCLPLGLIISASMGYVAVDVLKSK